MVREQRTEIPFPEEVEHLEQINSILDAALEKAEEAVERRDREYMETKRYMVEYRGEIDPRELFQNELLLKQIDRNGVFAVQVREKIAKLKGSPYFARIDFRETGGEEGLECYIGRFAFHHENQQLIYDWRAPIASMFYDCEVGPAGYEAPVGRIEGELTRKRQFKIKDGRMEYALETSANIQDDVLQRELSHTSDEKMKSIIATIQKEQNRIIRNEKAGTLIIQGVAGSGKTSIALHRIAFLLYRFKEQLSAENVMILSPNRVFGDYISNVLPELGEEPIRELGFEELAKNQLGGKLSFEPDRDPLEHQDKGFVERARFKSTLEFAMRLKNYVEQLPASVFRPEDCVFGRFTATADFIRRRFTAYAKEPIKRRLKMIADDIRERFRSDNIRGDQIPKAGEILKCLKTMLKEQDALALYRDFYAGLGRPELFRMPGKKRLEWADVYPFLYLRAALEGLGGPGGIRHLVVDEMQDYTPIQYMVLNELFPCQKTILGDFGQLVHPHHANTLLDLRQLYEGAEFVELNQSYRSTWEIMNFAARIGKVNSLEPMVRHGAEPVVLKCGSRQEEVERLEKLIGEFEEGEYSSLGILVKTDREAKELYDLLSRRCHVFLLSPESSSFVNGVSIASIRMSKGLEFDQVAVADVDDKAYATEYDRRLLYIACTRAMHKLTLLYSGRLSELIG